MPRLGKHPQDLHVEGLHLPPPDRRPGDAFHPPNQSGHGEEVLLGEEEFLRPRCGDEKEKGEEAKRPSPQENPHHAPSLSTVLPVLKNRRVDMISSSRSPSSTAATLPTSQPLRWSFTNWKGWRV